MRPLPAVAAVPARCGGGRSCPLAPAAPRPYIPQAIEQDLWALFSPAGDILELAILRSQGRSKGCAFLTFATRQQVRDPPSAAIPRSPHASLGNGTMRGGLLHQPCPAPRPAGLPSRCQPPPSRVQANAAINAFNGRQVGPSKRLVVKFADQKAPPAA